MRNLLSPDRNYFSSTQIRTSPNKKSERNKQHKAQVPFFSPRDLAWKRRRPVKATRPAFPGRDGMEMRRRRKALRGHKTHWNRGAGSWGEQNLIWRERVGERRLECGRQFERAGENRVTSFEWVRGILMLIMNPPSAEIQLTAKASPLQFFFWVTLLGTFNRRCQQTAVFPRKSGHKKQRWLSTFFIYFYLYIYIFLESKAPIKWNFLILTLPVNLLWPLSAVSCLSDRRQSPTWNHLCFDFCFPLCVFLTLQFSLCTPTALGWCLADFPGSPPLSNVLRQPVY